MMSAVPLQRAAEIAESSERRVTLLGATGSIGASAIDLLKRQPERYRIEAALVVPLAKAWLAEKPFTRLPLLIGPPPMLVICPVS